MGQGIPSTIVFAILLVQTSVTFLFMITTWTEHSMTRAQVINRELARVESDIALTSTAQTNNEQCDTFTVQANNAGNVTVPDLSEVDLIVEYNDASSNKVSSWLAHSTGWTVTSISPDTRDPDAWNPAETATISFTLNTEAKDGTSGTVIVANPLGISDSIYFSCAIS